MTINRNTLLVVGALLLAWILWAPSSPPSPFQPSKPRPVLTFLARAAKTALWLMMFAEGPPPERAQAKLVHTHGPDADGFERVNHGKGW